MSANRLKLNADKTEILWVGPKCTLSQLDGCMQFGADTTVASDHVCLLGVTITADLSLDQHVSGISATSFYWLRLHRQEFDIHLKPDWQQHLFVHLCATGLITVIPCLPLHQKS